MKRGEATLALRGSTHTGEAENAQNTIKKQLGIKKINRDRHINNNLAIIEL